AQALACAGGPGRDDDPLVLVEKVANVAHNGPEEIAPLGRTLRREIAPRPATEAGNVRLCLLLKGRKVSNCQRTETIAPFCLGEIHEIRRHRLVWWRAELGCFQRLHTSLIVLLYLLQTLRYRFLGAEIETDVAALDVVEQ